VEYDEHLTDIEDLLSDVAHMELPDLPGQDQPAYPLDPAPLIQSASRTAGLGIVGVQQVTGTQAILVDTADTATAVSAIGLIQGFPVMRTLMRRLVGCHLATLLSEGAAIVSLPWRRRSRLRQGQREFPARADLLAPGLRTVTAVVEASVWRATPCATPRSSPPSPTPPASCGASAVHRGGGSPQRRLRDDSCGHCRRLSATAWRAARAGPLPPTRVCAYGRGVVGHPPMVMNDARPRAIRRSLGRKGQHRRSRYLHNRLEQRPSPPQTAQLPDPRIRLFRRDHALLLCARRAAQLLTLPTDDAREGFRW
jgi:hypothetical protein